MKKYIYILITALIPLFYACEQETLPVYSGTDQIYFSYSDSTTNTSSTLIKSTQPDSVVILFGYDAVIKSDSIVGIGVNIMGNLTGYDRPVNFILVDSTSTARLGRDVELLSDRSFVPAGKNKGWIYIKLHNTENLNGTSLLASLRLVENEYFKTDYRTTPIAEVNKEKKIVSTEFRVRFDNANEKPNLWAHPATNYRFDLVFGTYSRVKFTLMCQILPGCTHEYFTYAPGEDPLTVFNKRFPMGLLAGWARGLSTYLITYKNEHNGTPLLDENGNEVTSGTLFN